MVDFAGSVAVARGAASIPVVGVEGGYGSDSSPAAPCEAADVVVGASGHPMLWRSPLPGERVP